jgi:phage gp29-like protein
MVADDSDTAARQKQALEYFYDNIEASEALRKDRHGGFAMLADQMMDAVGKGYAVHEILWQPARDNDGHDALKARFIFTPLWFFENKTGALRFLETDYATEGSDLVEGGWMVTTANSPLMEATSVAYVYKSLPLKDWLIYSERFGMPLVHGKTTAEQGSKEWDAFRDALRAINEDWRILTNDDASLDFHDVGASGERPQKPLVEYMDAAITVLWRGGDLSTKSAAAVGATLQEEERQNIEESDALMLSETLQQYVDKQIIRMLFGPAAPVLAYIKIQPKSRVDTQRDLNVWGSSIDRGVEISASAWREHFGLPTPNVSQTGEIEDPLVQKIESTVPATSGSWSGANALKLLEEASVKDVDEICAMVAANQQIGANNLPTRTAKALSLLLSTHFSTIGHDHD